jgi:RimJ/RimL family protein N-acetyltransferase
MKNPEDLTDWKVTLTGERIILKDLTIEDITQDYVDWMNDPEVVQFTESRFESHTQESIKAFVNKCKKSQVDILFGIFSKSNNLHLGNIKIGPISVYHKIADTGLIIGRKTYWGKGIATEAIQMLCNYAFDVLKIHKITASCYASNRGSKNAFLRAGFEQEGIRVKHARVGGEWVDTIEFGYTPHPSVEDDTDQ